MLKYVLLSASVLLLCFSASANRVDVEKAAVRFVKNMWFEQHKKDIQAAAHEFSNKCDDKEGEGLIRYLNLRSDNPEKSELNEEFRKNEPKLSEKCGTGFNSFAQKVNKLTGFHK